MDFYKQYPSGLRLVANKIDSYHTVSFGIMVDVGSIRETSRDNGYSHFIEHLLFKGTNSRTSLQISEEFDDIGASVNAYTSKDSTCFYAKSLSEHLEKCIDILSDMYFNASFPEDEMEKERGVVLEEIKMCNDTPDDVSQDLIAEALYSEQSLGQTILGTSHNIQYCDRHSIMEFKKKYYFANSTVVSVCGCFNFEDLDKWIVKYFEEKFVNDGILRPEPQMKYTSKFLHAFKDIEQSHLQMSWGACGLSSEDRPTLNLLSSILGGGMTSRLYQVIREQNGLAYTVYAYPSYYVNEGSFEIYVGLSPENISKVCKLLHEELDKIVQRGVSQKELDRAKTQAINSLYMNTENNLTLMRLYGRTMLKLGVMFNPESDVERYRSVTVDDVNAVACKYLSRSHASSYVGPKVKDFDLISKLCMNAIFVGGN